MRARTQASIAISGDGEAWYLLGASPEIRAQIESFPPLHPRAPRDTPIAGIVLANGDLDHTLGLLSLRESQPLQIHATAAVRRSFLEGNGLARTLERIPGQVVWNTVVPGTPADLAGLSLTAVAVPGKVPTHGEGRFAPSPEDNVGYLVRDAGSGRTLAWFPGVGGPTEALSALSSADAIFFDGTFWTEDELIRLGLGTKRARDMAHWPAGGPSGSLAHLAGLRDARRLFIHVNNTNPLLRDDSAERGLAAAAGVEVAEDGLEILL